MTRFTHIAVLSILAILGLCSQAAATVTLSPFPGTPTALAHTQISFLGASASSLSSISVVGSSSGRHSGYLASYASETGVSFLVRRPFAAGEHVVVHATWKSPTGARSRLSTYFTIAQQGAISQTEFTPVPGTPADVQRFSSEPGLHPPTVTVRQPAGAGSAPGYLLAAPFLGPGQWGPMIFDNAGSLVWFRPLPAGQDAADFRTQMFRGTNSLTWWQGITLTFGYGLGEDVVANSNYKIVAVVKAGNGLRADEHEFLLNPRDSAYVLAYNPVTTSLSSAGGPASGLALDGGHTGDRHSHGPGHVGMAQPRQRRCLGVLRQTPRAGEQPLRLPPHQLADDRRSRGPPGVRPQHLGAL